MAYDEELASRIRRLLAGQPGVSERKMFGGLAFLLNGNMLIAASGQGGLLVRTDPASSAALRKNAGVEVMVMRDKEMPGWLRVGSDAVEKDGDLDKWVRIGQSYVRTLPPK